MNRKNNGVTMTALVVTLIVLTIMLSVTMNVSAELLSDSKIKSYIAEMYTVQARIKSMAETLEFESDNYSIADCKGSCGTFHEKLFTNATIVSLLNNLGYYNTASGKEVNKIGVKLTNDELNAIPGINNHSEYNSGEMAKCWYKWDYKVLADNGFDASMLNGGVYYVNYYNYEVIYGKGFTTTSTPRETVYSLSDMLEVRKK